MESDNLNMEKHFAYWPSEHMSMRISLTGTTHVTPAFSMATSHSTLLMVGNRYGAIHADVRISNSETLLTLSAYTRGSAPVQLVNATRSVEIDYCERGAEGKQRLKPGQTVFYAWMDPNGARTLLWYFIICTLLFRFFYRTLFSEYMFELICLSYLQNEKKSI